MKDVSAYLIAGFGIAVQRPHYILIDMIGKGVWLVLSSVIFWAASLWFLSTITISDGEFIWFQNGVSVLSLLRVLQTIVSNSLQLGQSLIVGSVVSLLLWIVIEAFVRSGLLPLTENRLYQDAVDQFPRFVLTGLIRRFILITVGILIGFVSLGPLLTTPRGEWSSVWLAVQWPVLAGVILFAVLAFFLTILDTLIRCDALELCGRSLPEVICVTVFPVVLEIFVWVIGSGFLIIATRTNPSPGALLVLTGCLMIGLSIVHSYLLLARYSAIGIMQLDS